MTFIKILFLGKAVLLTLEPVSIDEQLLLELDNSVSAITTGATLRINVSSMFDEIGIQKLGYIKSLKTLNDYFSQGSVTTELLSEDENITIKLDIMSFSLTNDGADLVLSSSEGIPVDVEFNRIHIMTKVPLYDVTITWKNHLE